MLTAVGHIWFISFKYDYLEISGNPFNPFNLCPITSATRHSCTYTRFTRSEMVVKIS